MPEIMNRKFFTPFIFTCLLILASCGNGKKNTTEVPEDGINPDLMENPATAGSNSRDLVPVFAFQDSVHDFGKIIDGEVVTYAFRFKNTGKGDLIIRSASGSCGCTVPEFPKDPIKPGGSGIITVTFNSEGRVGMQNKTVTIISNTIPSNTFLSISAEVLPKK